MGLGDIGILGYGRQHGLEQGRPGFEFHFITCQLCGPWRLGQAPVALYTVGSDT